MTTIEDAIKNYLRDLAIRHMVFDMVHGANSKLPHRDDAALAPPRVRDENSRSAGRSRRRPGYARARIARDDARVRQSIVQANARRASHRVRLSRRGRRVGAKHFLNCENASPLPLTNHALSCKMRPICCRTNFQICPMVKGQICVPFSNCSLAAS